MSYWMNDKKPSIEEAHKLSEDHARGQHGLGWGSVHRQRTCPDCDRWPSWKLADLWQGVYALMGGECGCGYHYNECDNECCPEDSDHGPCVKETMTGLTNFMDDYWKDKNAN